MRDDNGPTKKKKVFYWGAETEAAIIEFNQTQEQESRDRIYTEKLHAPFCKLVENIVNRFKFPYIGESYQSIHNDALGHLVKNIHQFSPSKGKSFGYASIVVKNYLIQRNSDYYKRHNREVPVVEYDDPEYEESVRASNDVALLSYEAPSYDVKEFFRLLVDWWEVNLSKVFDYDYERTIAKAVLQTMADIPDLAPQGRGGTGRRELYKELRNLTGKRTQHIGRVVGIMAKQYPKLQRKYIEKGYLLKNPSSIRVRRRNQGAKNKQSKLTDDKVREIRRIYAEGKYTQREVGKMFGVNDSVVSTIVRGKAWKHTLPEGFSSLHSYRWQGRNKLAESQVLSMRKESREGMENAELALMYGVSLAAVKNITAGRSWKHLPVSLASSDTHQSDNQSLLVAA